MNLKTEFPVYYDDIKGWVVLSDETLTPSMLLFIRNYVYRVNSQRMKDYQGEKRKRIELALQRLQTDGLSVVSSKPGITMFQANEKMKPTSYFFMGGQ